MPTRTRTRQRSQAARRYRPRRTIKYTCARRKTRWSQADLCRLVWLADHYRNEAQRLRRLAAIFERSPRAIRAQLIAIGWARGLTLRAISRRLGMSESSLLTLISHGRFIPGLPRHDRPEPYGILEDELWEWMTDMASWQFWRPEAITDPVWRAHFGELRRNWLTAQEVSAILHFSLGYVHRLRKLGLLPGRKVSARGVWYHRADVVAVQARLAAGNGGFTGLAAAARREVRA